MPSGVRVESCLMVEREATRLVSITGPRCLPNEEEYLSLEESLGYSFSDRDLLIQAFTHRSRAHEDRNNDVVDNESLEFLGDAVLGLVIADWLFREFPTRDEGWKSKMKAILVAGQTLTGIGNSLGLGRYLLLGKGEEKTGGREKPSLIADTLEAVIGAIYLDGGMETIVSLIHGAFSVAFNEIRKDHADLTQTTRDWKSSLQEWVQARGHTLPRYRLSGQSGPDHQKEFSIEVLLDNGVVGRGEGHSKKEAEQQAAKSAFRELDGKKKNH